MPCKLPAPCAFPSASLLTPRQRASRGLVSPAALAHTPSAPARKLHVQAAGKGPTAAGCDLSFSCDLGCMHRQGSDGAWAPDPLIADERYVAARVRGRGLVVFSACSHAGIVNVVQDAAAASGEPGACRA